MNGPAPEAVQLPKMTLVCKNSKNRKTTKIIFRNRLLQNKPAKFRRPDTTLGGMSILRQRCAAAFLHDQDPQRKSTQKKAPDVAGARADTLICVKAQRAGALNKERAA